MDRLAALLVLASFVIGTAAMALLLLHRIDANVYGVVALVSLVITFALVMRWRSTRTVEERA